MACVERPNFCVLRHGGRGCGSSRGIGHHHFRLPHARYLERGPGRSPEIMNPNLYLWLIPLLPLVGAAVNGVFRRRFSKKAVAGGALFFSGPAFLPAFPALLRFFSLALPYVRTRNR